MSEDKVKQAVGGALVVAGVATGIGVLAGTAGAASFLGLSGTSAFFAQQFATSFALTAVSTALSKQPSAPSLSVQAAGRTNFFKQPITNRSIVYGEVRTSGPLIYAESTDDEQYLHLVIALAGHEVESIGDIYFNDEVLTLSSTGTDGNGISQLESTSPDRYDGLVFIKKHLGADDQAADADLVASSDSLWTINHRLRGTAYIYVRLKYDQDAFPSGIPQISAVVQGKKVYDPRTETTAYSNNAALIIRDYLADSEYGLGATSSELNETAFEDAANLCDESVSLAAGGTESRYTANGVIDSGASPRANIQQMLTSCLGTLYYSGGQWALKAAGYTAPVASFTNDDLRGVIDLQTRQSRRDNFNGVKGVFISPDSNWQPTDYPPITSATFEAVDGGQQTLLDLELPFTTSVATAQRLAKIMLGKQRQQLTMNLKMNLKPMDITVGDTIQFTNSRFGWTNKIFEVIGWTFNPNPQSMGVDLQVQETSSTVYDWTPGTDEQAFEQDNTTLPDPFYAPTPTLGASSVVSITDGDSAVVYGTKFQWTDTNPYTEFYEVVWKAGVSGDEHSEITKNKFFIVSPAEKGVTYYLKVRSVNTLGVKSAFTSEDTETNTNRNTVFGESVIDDSVPVVKLEPGTNADYQGSPGTPDYAFFYGPSGTGFTSSPFAIGGKSYTADKGGAVAYAEQGPGIQVHTESDGFNTGSYSAGTFLGAWDFDESDSRTVANIGNFQYGGRFRTGDQISRNITGATNANPVVITTSADHDLVTGNEVAIGSVGGMTELNGNNYIITVISATTFSLDGTDGTGFGTYTSGGNFNANQQEFISTSVGADVLLAYFNGSTSYSVYTNVGTAGPFTASHDGLIERDQMPQLGDILVDVDVIASPSINDAITSVEISGSANQAGVIGVCAGFMDDDFVPASLGEDLPFEVDVTLVKEKGRKLKDEYLSLLDTYKFIKINAIGEGRINVCGQNGDIAVGDLIVASDISGKGMRQDDDIIRSYTVAKSREAVTFESSDEVKQIACIYLGG